MWELHSFVFPKLDKQITKSCKLLFSHSRALPLSQQTYIYGFENIFVPHRKMSLENMPTVAPKTQLGLKIIPMATKPSFTLKYDLMNLVVATFVQKLCRRWLNLSGFTIGKELRRIGSHFKASQLSSSSSKNIFPKHNFLLQNASLVCSVSCKNIWMFPACQQCIDAPESASCSRLPGPGP